MQGFWRDGFFKMSKKGEERKSVPWEWKQATGEAIVSCNGKPIFIHSFSAQQLS